MFTGSNQRFHLILDFGGTIVKNNTIPLFDYLRSDQESTTYSTFAEPYMNDHEQHIQNYRPVKANRTFLYQEYEYLDSLTFVERASIKRIDASNWLKGLRWSNSNLSVFQQAAYQIDAVVAIQWRFGFLELVQAVWQNNGIVDILSVNWSGNFIRSLLRHEFLDKIDVDRLRIYANEINPSGTGRISRIESINGDQLKIFWPEPGSTAYDKSKGLWTQGDKVEVMRSIARGSETGRMMTVYVGDSKTDLGCIMEADLGICMRHDNDPSEEAIDLIEVLDRLHTKQTSIDRFSKGDTCSENSVGVVWFANDFSFIH